MENVLESEEQFNKFLESNGYCLVNFCAVWSDISMEVNKVLHELKLELLCFNFATIEVEKFHKISEAYKITLAPTIVFFKKGKQIDRLEGYDPVLLKTKILTHNVVAGVPGLINEPTIINEMTTKYYFTENLEKRLKSLINQAPLMLFMKGTPENPRCGFSRQMVILLNSINAKYSSFNILEDDEVRQGLKEYSGWPTYPQLYLNGALIGGLDVVKEEMNDPEFCKKLQNLEKIESKTSLKMPEVSMQSELIAHRLTRLINKAPLMLFMKGSPENQRCVFSIQAVNLLNSVNAEYSTFNILDDDDVRQGLKIYSNWPTYPQLYMNGLLVGGLDVMKEKFKDPNFVESLPKKKKD